MIDHDEIVHALRVQAKASSACLTTDAIDATATGYSRAVGSFLVDKFAVGMELIGSGFLANTNNGAHVITGVDASTVTCAGTAVESGSPGVLSVGFPSRRAWENIALEPPNGQWYVEEDYVPGPAQQITVGESGEIEGEPMYVLKLYCPDKVGTEAPYRVADAVLRSFAPRRALPLPSGDVVRVRTNPAPYRGQLQAADAGRAVVVVTVPLRIRSLNII